MLTTKASDKYIIALKRLKVKPVANKWYSEHGVCPLYAYTLYKMRADLKANKYIVLKKMLELFGIDFRNGFTAAYDGLPEESNNPNYTKGYEEGLEVKRDYPS